MISHFGNAFLFTVVGIITLSSGGDKFHMGYIQYSAGKHYILIGGAFIAVACYLFYIGYKRNKNSFKNLISEKVLMCPSCGNPFNESDVTFNKCPECNVDLEKIEGFYERHPEFK